MHSTIAGIRWERLEREGSVTYPCMSESDPGQPIVFQDRFPTTDGRVKLVPTALITAAKRPDADYPLVLIDPGKGGLPSSGPETGTRRRGVRRVTSTLQPLRALAS